MFNSGASVSNKVICLNDYIDRKYLSISEIVDKLNELVDFEVTDTLVWRLLSIKGLVVLNCQYGHEITTEAKEMTARVYRNGQLEILWKRELFPRIVDLIEIYFPPTLS